MKAEFTLAVVLISAGLPNLFAQEAPLASTAIDQNAWRVVDQPDVPQLQPARSERPAAPLTFEPLVLISEPAATAPQTMPVPSPYPRLPASAPVYALPPQPVPPPVTTYKPLIPITPLPKQYYLGRGLFGQPKLYVPQQPIRNFLRYLSM